MAAVGLVTALMGIRSAVATVIVPRAVPSRLNRLVFIVVRLVFTVLLAATGRRRPWTKERDRLLAFYAPVSLLTLQAVWLILVGVGYVLAFAALSGSWSEGFRLSGSSLTTLGFDRPSSLTGAFLSFTEAAAGLAILTLLITYLPSLYSAFGRRELLVRKLEVRAGNPPSGVALLERAFGTRRQHGLPEIWQSWESWFVDVEESHTSFAALAFFRSPTARLSWITAAGAILDGAALLLAVMPENAGACLGETIGRDVDDAGELSEADPLGAEVCLRTGALALRRIAAYYAIPLDDPAVGESISVDETEFAEAYERLRVSQVPLGADCATSWRAFQSWRGRYDRPLVRLAGLVEAPPAPWSSDRPLSRQAIRLRFRTQHVDAQPADVGGADVERPGAA
jgi:hypothetical protein